MKKVLLFTAVLGAFTFASCKKDRTCTCTDSDGEEYVTTYPKTGKASAKLSCEGLNVGGYSCKLD